MSMDLTGIRNQNEYYTNHYFLSVFEENAADTIKRWQDEAANQGGKTPWAKLNAAASKYFSLRERASRLRSDVLLEPIISELASEVLTALDYPMHARSAKPIEVEPGVTIPVALEMTRPNGAPWMWAILCRNASDDDDIMQSVRFHTRWHGFADEETGYWSCRRRLTSSGMPMWSCVVKSLKRPPIRSLSGASPRTRSIRP